MLGQIMQYLSNLSGGQSDEPVKKESLLKEYLRKGKVLKNKIKEKCPLWGKALRKDTLNR